MIRKFTAFAVAATLAAAAFAPAAQAQHYRGGGYGHYRGGYYGHRYYGYRDNVVGAGVLGLVLGLAIGAAASDHPYREGGGYAPPPPPPQQYQGYDPSRGGPPPQSDNYRDGSAYEEDYGVDPKLDGGPQASSCTHQERQWDRYANRYVTVDVPC